MDLGVLGPHHRFQDQALVCNSYLMLLGLAEVMAGNLVSDSYSTISPASAMVVRGAAIFFVELQDFYRILY